MTIERFSLKDPGVRTRVDSGEITYIGRDFAGLRNQGLGNPFFRGNRPIGTTLAQYEQWLISEIRMQNPKLLAGLQQVVTSKKIACWCKTHEQCHGNIIARIAQSIIEVQASG